MAGDKKTQLLDAAKAVFTEHGIAGGTIDQITGRAGVGKGTFYLYFRTKDDVIKALQQRHWEVLLEAAAQAESRLDGDDWWNGIDVFIDTVIAFNMEHRDWHRLVVQGWGPPQDPEEAQFEQHMIDWIAARIRDGQSRGLCSADDPQIVATLLYRAVHHTAMQLTVQPGPLDDRHLADVVKQFVRRVLAVSPAPVAGTVTPIDGT